MSDAELMALSACVFAESVELLRELTKMRLERARAQAKGPRMVREAYNPEDGPLNPDLGLFSKMRALDQELDLRGIAEPTQGYDYGYKI